LTVAETARLLRVGEDRVRGWIKRGHLAAIDTADPGARKPRYVVLPDALQRFIQLRTVASAPKPARKSRLRFVKDYYP
jgi:excisionase family DNA binding protein